MSPTGKVQSKKVVAPNNLYTVYLGFALLIVVATVAYISFQCYQQYGVIPITLSK
jgi:hypothetical protein